MEDIIGSTPQKRRWVLGAALSCWLLIPASLFLAVALTPAPGTDDIVCDGSKTWWSPPASDSNTTTWSEDLGLEWPDLSWMCFLCGTQIGAGAWDWGWTVIYPVTSAFYYLGVALWALFEVLLWVPEGVQLLNHVSSLATASLGECVHISSVRVLQLYALTSLDAVSLLLATSVFASALLKGVPQAAARAEAAELDGTAVLAPRWASGCWDWAVAAFATWAAPGLDRRPRRADATERRRIGVASDASRRVTYPSMDVNAWGTDSRSMFAVLTSLDGAGFGIAQRSVVLVALELVQPTVVSGTLRFLLSNPMLVRLALMVTVAAGSSRLRLVCGLGLALFELVVAPGAAAFGIATNSELGTFRIVTEVAVFGVFMTAVVLALQLLDGSTSRSELKTLALVAGVCIALTGVQHWFGLRGLFAGPLALDGWLVVVGGVLLALAVLAPAVLAFAFAFSCALAVVKPHLPASLHEAARGVLHIANPHLTSLTGPISERLDEAFKEQGAGFVVAVICMAFFAGLTVVLHPFDDPQAKGCRDLYLLFHPQPLWSSLHA